MIRRNFVNSEKHLIELFNNCGSFNYNGIDFEVLVCGKPRPNSGECKTDIYVMARNKRSDEKTEFKISIKQSNADFLENKIQLNRTKEIFGEDAQKIIYDSIQPIRDKFISDFLINFKAEGRTEKFCIKIGWKFELLNKPCGYKSGKIELSQKQMLDIYSGINLDPDKRNCTVEGLTIQNSGVANSIMIVDRQDQDLPYYLGKMQAIEEYIKDKGIYFACKALNYRCLKSKWDGDRPLAVYVDWKLIDNKLVGNIVFDKPLSVRGNQIGNNIREILEYLGIDKNNFCELKRYISPYVNIIP